MTVSRKKGVGPKPLLFACFFCKNWLLVKYVPWKKRFSLKNNLEYWTKNESDKEKKICDHCLKDLYQRRKKDKEFFELIPDLERRMVLRNYICRFSEL